MTNGPGAVLAEIVENPLPKDRGRIDLHRHPLYYALRNHIVDFLVSRSKTFAAETPGHDPRNVPLVRIGKPELVIASVADLQGDRPMRRHGRAWPGHPRLHEVTAKQDVDARDEPGMTSERENTMKRSDLTEKLLDIKREKGWSWKHICETDRRLFGGADRRRHSRPDEADQAAGRQCRRAVRPVEVRRSRC